MLPDFPESTTGSQKWLLTSRERKVALERILVDRVAQEDNRTLWYGFVRAVADYRTWVFVSANKKTNSAPTRTPANLGYLQVFVMLCNHVAYGFNYFYPTIVKGFGFGSDTVTQLLTAPPFLVGAILSLAISWSSDRRTERSLHVAVPMGIAIVGFVISVATLNGPARYVASFLYVTGCFAANGLLYSWAASVLNQTPEKKAVATSMINVLAQLGNIMSPYFFRSQDQPRYVLALILLIAFAGMSGLLCLFLKWDLTRANRKIRAESEANGTVPGLFIT